VLTTHIKGKNFMKKTFFKKLLPLMLFALTSLIFIGNVAGTELSDAPQETTDLEWTLIIDGAVNQPLNLTLSDLATMPRKTVNSALYCLGSLVTLGDWVGVRIEYLLETAGIQDEAASLTFYASDGYQIRLDLTEAFQENVIIAYELDGHPLSETLRLVLPGKNGNNWIAWVTKITATTVPGSTSDISAYLPPKLPQPPSMSHSTDTPQPSGQPTTPPDASSSQEIDSTVNHQYSQATNLPANHVFALLALAVVIIVATTAYLYLKRTN
jgi:DMSO/TMAO reductase YedYZ molybdopterin-dependent catalytic subunit